MHDFVRNLITAWRRLGLRFEDDTIVVGVSGGADSVSLLLAMHELQQKGKLDLRIVAAHFNHRLRGGESDGDEEFVRHLTQERKIELAVGHAGPSNDGNIEQNARTARYDFLRKTADNVNAFAILTGHTINDQAETFLMNLIRGSGPQGLCGMKPVRSIDSEPPAPADGCDAADDEAADAEPLLFPTSPLLVRPLLSWAKRIDTEGYCRAIGVEYRYDTMNEDTAFKRVRIRKILLPLLEDFNPRIIDTLANTAALMQSLPLNTTSEAAELQLRELKTLEKPELYETLRSWLASHRGNTRQLELKHMQALERLVLSVKSGRTAELPGGKVVKSGRRIRYEEIKVEN
ncbi:MAG: tRNA lysidine(34) synthetase TilS [Pyrinomonadaceae bacterium]